MRIGLFTDSYLPAMNGIVHVVESARKNLEAFGHEVYVVAPKTGLREPESSGNMLWIPAVGDIFFEDQATSLFFPPIQYRRIAKLELDVIIFFTPGQIGMLGAYCAIKQEIPLVSQYCTDVSQYIEEYPSAVFGLLALTMAAPFALNMSLQEVRETTKAMILGRDHNISRRKHMIIKMLTVLHSRCDAVVAVSKKMTKQLRSWDKSVKVSTIPTGVDPLPVDLQASKAFRREHNIDDDEKVVMYAGRLAPEKNLDLLIDAFDHIGKKEPKAKLVFVGDFSYREQLEAHARASDYPQQIIFVGRLPRESLGSVYASADVFAFPSLTDTQALVVNEAALTGLPAVWIDKGINEVLVTKKTGLQARNNPKDFAKKVLTLLSDEKTRKKYGQAASKQAKTLSEKIQTKKLVELLESL